MKGLNRKQYIMSLIVCFIAIATLSFCTISSFYKKAVKDTLALGDSALNQQKEQMDAYLSRAMDAVEVTAIMVESMMKRDCTSEEILTFLTQESEYYMEDVDESFTGIYGVFRGDYLDGIGWQPEEGYIPEEREWYIEACEGNGVPVIVKPYVDAQTGQVMVSISQLLYDKKSVISLDVSLESLQEATEAIQLNDQGFSFVCDDRGLIITHSKKKQVGKTYTKGDYARVLKKVYQADRNTFQEQINGHKVTVFSSHVMETWYAVMIMDDQQLYKKVRILSIYDILLSILVYMVVVLFCTWSMKKTDATMQQLDERNNELKENNDAVLQVLAKIIDAKDKYTKGHSLRVAAYSRELARRMGRSEEEQDRIYRIGLLHDIGKVRVPDTIINKPGKLTDQEFSMIKLHSVAGYYILKELKLLKELAVGAKYHHERYDGKGYPSGLKGDNIPECARIIAVADSYDAMASNRSYRDALPQDVVRAEIERGRGTQFDPSIADIMLDMIKEDKEYRMRQNDESKRHILVVDDEKMNIRLVQNICKGEPMYEIISALSGQEAVAYAKEQRVDLILLDIEMPDMDGFETLEKIRSFSDVPVIFITATKDYEVIERARAQGVDDYITKPFLPAVLLETVRGIVS